MTCELCGAEDLQEFGDVNGAIVCMKCLGGYGDKPDPEVTSLLNFQEQE